LSGVSNRKKRRKKRKKYEKGGRGGRGRDVLSPLDAVRKKRRHRGGKGSSLRLREGKRKKKARMKIIDKGEGGILICYISDTCW